MRALGSLAQEVMDAGVAGVVAMALQRLRGHSAQFVADLYAALTQGQALGEAVTLGRQQLHSHPLAEKAPNSDCRTGLCPSYMKPRLSPLPRPRQAGKIAVSLQGPKPPRPPRGDLAPNLPKAPDVGFSGATRRCSALTAPFDTEHIVLLHATRAAGKTTTAASSPVVFADGRRDGPSAVHSFEQYKTLSPRAGYSWADIRGVL